MAMRLLFAFFLFVFGSVCAQELNNPNKLKLCPKNKNVTYHNCWGTFESKGDRYVGEFKKNEFHGQGAYTWANGNKYVGEWKKNVKNGQGAYTWANGNKYVGEFKDNKANGRGTYFMLANDEFKGDVYVGEFKDDNFHGMGTYSHADGDKYVGEYKDGQRNGQGTFYSLSNDQFKGDVYVGEFKEGNFHGLGTYIHFNGNRYFGEHKDGERTGQGIFSFTSGLREIGEFRDGKLNGRAVRLKIDGSIEDSGLFKDDELVESFEIDTLSFTRIPRQYLTTEKNLDIDTNPVVSKIDENSSAEIQQENESVSSDQVENSEANNQRTSADNRRRFALVIGNSNYSNLPKLQNSINDARLITQSLRSAGFQVSTYENLDMGDMQNAIRAFGDRLSKTDVGLFYYAGHAVQVKGKNYLIPVKENIKKSFEVQSRAIDVNDVLATLENIKNDLNIVVLDACRSSFPGEARGTNQGLASIEAAKGTFIAFATAPGKEALDGDGTNSPYSKHLARLIGKKGLPLEQVFKEVRKAVVAETRGSQVPWENSSLMGDFYFKK
jgi:hypothetical protein